MQFVTADWKHQHVELWQITSNDATFLSMGQSNNPRESKGQTE
jgi:hypothetical protein